MNAPYKNVFIIIKRRRIQFSNYLDDVNNTHSKQKRRTPGVWGGGGGGALVNFCWVCAAGLSESLPLYSLFFWPIIDPMLVMINFGQM